MFLNLGNYALQEITHVSSIETYLSISKELHTFGEHIVVVDDFNQFWEMV